MWGRRGLPHMANRRSGQVGKERDRVDPSRFEAKQTAQTPTSTGATRTRRALLAQAAAALALTASGFALPDPGQEADAERAPDSRVSRGHSRPQHGRPRRKRDRRGRMKHGAKQWKGGKYRGGKSKQNKQTKDRGNQPQGLQLTVVNATADTGLSAELWDLNGTTTDDNEGYVLQESFALPASNGADPVVLQSDRPMAYVWFPGQQWFIWLAYPEAAKPKRWGFLGTGGGILANGEWDEEAGEMQVNTTPLLPQGIHMVAGSGRAARKITLKPDANGANAFILDIGPA